MGKRKRVKESFKQQVVYVFLLKNTDLGAKDRTRWARGQQAVSRRVKEEGGQCTFFVTAGGQYDGVSLVSGVTAEAAIRLTGDMERWGTVRAIRLSGIRILK